MAAIADTKNSITLKGSAKLVSEFFYYGINSILYQRGIYPDDKFIRKEQYGLKVLVTDDEKVNEYLKQVLDQIREWLEKGQIQRLVLVINAVATEEVLERWDFQIEAATGEGPLPTMADGVIGEKDLKAIRREMGDVIRQITSCVTFLPSIDQQCAFDLLVYTKKDVSVPNAWSDSPPCFINNCQEVRLKSISTSVHQVKAAVSYKFDL